MVHRWFVVRGLFGECLGVYGYGCAEDFGEIGVRVVGWVGYRLGSYLEWGYLILGLIIVVFCCSFVRSGD